VLQNILNLPGNITADGVEMALLEVEQLEERVSRASAIQVELLRDWRQAASRLNGASHRTTFQHGAWLGAWYDAFRNASPLIAVVSDTVTQRDLAVVPLIRRVRRGIRFAEFADLGLSDYNAPILSPAAPADAAAARAICQALLAALRKSPEGLDLLRMQKMPAEIEGKPNPLAQLGRIGSCSLNGNLVTTGEDFEAYRASIKRMQLPRCWRVFSRNRGAEFRMASDVDDAFRVLDAMDVQQRERMTRLGLAFVLDDTCHAKFYRDIVVRGFAHGFAVVSALKCGEEVVATALGIRRGTKYSLLRTSYGGTRWANCSPGLLVVERTMAALHKEGVRQFDLSIGNYGYKRRFGAQSFPLTDVSIALSWRGIPYVVRDRSAQWLRRYPRLAARVARALGKSAPGGDRRP
jgi:CelD/BcsL family acetyltransferase involved in cellulose biosynthesis